MRCRVHCLLDDFCTGSAGSGWDIFSSVGFMTLSQPTDDSVRGVTKLFFKDQPTPLEGYKVCTTQRRVKVKGIRLGLNIKKPIFINPHRGSYFETYVNDTVRREDRTLDFLSSNDSPTNCGSSLIVILYRETSMASTAVLEVSANL